MLLECEQTAQLILLSQHLLYNSGSKRKSKASSEAGSQLRGEALDPAA